MRLHTARVDVAGRVWRGRTAAALALCVLATLAVLGTTPSVHAAMSRTTAAPTVPTVPGRALRLCDIGDSIFQRGSFASTRTRSYVELVAARLALRGPVARVDATMHHDAQGSTTLATIDSVPSGCDVVLLGLGTNNARERQPDGSFTYSTSAIYRDAGSLLDRIVAANPSAVLVGTGVWGPSGVRTARVDALLGERVMTHGGTFVPVSDLYDYTPNRLPAGVAAFPVPSYRTDGFHPNDAGHAALARRVLRCLGVPPA